MSADDSLEVIGALGAGRMGRGIAHAFAFAGHRVLLIDLKSRSATDADELRDEAFAEIGANLAALARAGVLLDAECSPILDRIEFVPAGNAAARLPEIDVAFEGVPETLQAKEEAFGLAGQYLKPDAVVASTTSTILSTQLAGFVANPERYLNAHWLNPAYLIPLVELMPHPGTADEYLARMRLVLERIGKVPIVCAAAPGYIVARLQSLVMNEAARMIEQGVASAEEIDRATRYGFGIRYAAMGVCEFIDYGGTDILYYASRYLANALDDDRYASPSMVDRLMEDGHLGVKTGRGLMDWSQVDPEAYRDESLARLLSLLREQKLLPAAGCALVEQ